MSFSDHCVWNIFGLFLSWEFFMHSVNYSGSRFTGFKWHLMKFYTFCHLFIEVISVFPFLNVFCSKKICFWCVKKRDIQQCNCACQFRLVSGMKSFFFEKKVSSNFLHHTQKSFDPKGHVCNFWEMKLKGNLCGFKALSMRFGGSRQPLTRGPFSSCSSFWRKKLEDGGNLFQQ